MKMKISKILASLLMVSIISTNLSPIFISAKSNVLSEEELALGEVVQVGDYDMQLIQKTPNYSKIEFLNTITHEVEYLEEIKNNGKSEFNAKSNRSNTHIIREKNSITIQDMKTNKRQVIKPNVVTVSPNTEAKSIINAPENGGIVLQSGVNDGWTPWEYQGTSTGSTYTLVRDISLLTALIAAIYRAPATVTVVRLSVQIILAKALPEIYWKEIRYMRFAELTTAEFEEKYVSSTYMYADYTGIIGSHEEVVRYAW